MSDIQVGDYVRINNDFRVIALGIGKVIKINQDTIYVKMSFEMPFTFKKENITKHSRNLIDLIEVNDYVNGMLVQKIAEPSLANDYKKLIYCNECEGLYEGIFDNNEIKTIVTHEQFNSVMYKVKE